MASPKTVKLRFFGLFVLLLAIFALVAFRHAGRWLVLDDPYRKGMRFLS